MNQKEIYDKVYETNDTLWDNSDQIIHKIINSDFEKNLKNLRAKHSKGVALNLGSGTASNLSELNKYCDNVICIDISKKGLIQARYKYSSNEYILADAASLPFRNEVFNYVEGIAILHHIKNYESALIGLKYCIKKGGFLIFVEPGILNPQAFLVRTFFPTPFHVPEERPFFPFMLKKKMQVIYGKGNIKIFYGNILTYGGSLIIKANKITIPVCTIARYFDRIFEKIPFFNEFCGHMIILIRK